MSNEDFGKIELTDEEMKDAILEGKRKKYFRMKHGSYWQEKKGAGDDYPVIDLDQRVRDSNHEKFLNEL